MTEAASTVVNEPRFAEGLDRLAAALTGKTDLIDAFAAFARTADDRAIVRINAVRFGQQFGFPTKAVVELFLHARKLGLVTMEWQYICPGCGEVVERLTSLTSATAHYFCQVCSADRDADLSEFVPDDHGAPDQPMILDPICRPIRDHASSWGISHDLA